MGEGMGFIDEPILDGQPVRVLEINRTESHPVGVDYSGENPHAHIRRQFGDHGEGAAAPQWVGGAGSAGGGFLRTGIWCHCPGEGGG